MRQTCKNCGRRFIRSDRWHRVHHRFLFWTWSTREHFSCADPTLGPAKPRLKGEVPLPFPGPMERVQ